MRKFRVAIHMDEGKVHSTNWALEWARSCERNGIEFDYIDCYSMTSIRDLESYDALFWHFSHYSKRDMMFARSILRSVKALGLKVFPDTEDMWHFDDKVAQDYFLKSLNINVPESRVFFTSNSVKEWLDENPVLPVVAKLRCGSGSQNVRLLDSKAEVLKYADTMFQKNGFSTIPSVAFKTKSNILSVKSVADIVARAKKIPDFINTLAKSRSLDREQGYLYVQSLVANDGFDLKVVVVGNKLSFIGRRSRGDDFRASGGGDLFYDKDLITPEVIDLCFNASDSIGSSCMGFDVVVDQSSGKPYIIEMSYGFSYAALLDNGGYWDRQHNWINESLNAPEDVLMTVLSRIV